MLVYRRFNEWHSFLEAIEAEVRLHGIVEDDKKALRRLPAETLPIVTVPQPAVGGVSVG